MHYFTWKTICLLYTIVFIFYIIYNAICLSCSCKERLFEESNSLCIYSLFCSKYKLSFQMIKNDDIPGIRIAVIMTYYTLSCTVTLNIANIIIWYSAEPFTTLPFMMMQFYHLMGLMCIWSPLCQDLMWTAAEAVCLCSVLFPSSQAEFSEVNLVSHSNSTCNVDMQVIRGGTKVVRSVPHTLHPHIYIIMFPLL